jgi:hypothetical protein
MSLHNLHRLIGLGIENKLHNVLAPLNSPPPPLQRSLTMAYLPCAQSLPWAIFWAHGKTHGKCWVHDKVMLCHAPYFGTRRVFFFAHSKVINLLCIFFAHGKIIKLFPLLTSKFLMLFTYNMWYSIKIWYIFVFICVSDQGTRQMTRLYCML